jgi:mannose-6-phosphate isomerase-like protein (cupin superfamily)
MTPTAFQTTVLLRSEQTDGELSAIVNTVPAGWAGPPLHHHGFDELFYVVEGELTFQLGEEIVTRRAGEIAFARRGAHHAFANPGEVPARTLIACTPAGFERYFGQMAARQAGVDPPDWALQPTPEVVRVGPHIGAPMSPGQA